MKISSFGASDVGLVRLNNEDVWAKLPNEHCYILADGMGGHKAGEIAASEAVIHLCKCVKQHYCHCHSVDEWIKLLREGVAEANHQVHTLSHANADMEGMGTTLCLALICHSTLISLHIGDSRIYRIRKNRITRLTNDHSLRSELIEKGELDESHASKFPYKNVITRAIGTQQKVDPEIQVWETQRKDIYFLCSDGLTDNLSDSQILDIIQARESLEEATESLILAAKKQGGNDNITIVMLKIEE